VKLNDVVLAPPSLTFGGAGKKHLMGPASTNKTKAKDLPVSMKQKAEMEVERERAIARYREIKARQLASKGALQSMEGDEET